MTHVKSILPDEWKKKLGHIIWNMQKWEHLGCKVVLGKVEITGEEYLLVLVEQRHGRSSAKLDDLIRRNSHGSYGLARW